MMEEGEETFDFTSWRWIPEEDGSAAVTGEGLVSSSRSIVAAESVNAEDFTGIGEPLKTKFRSLMESYPNGISLFAFVSQFQKRHGYYPDYATLQYSSVDKLFRSLNDVVTVVDSPLGEPLLFSNHLKDIVTTPLKIFEKTWMQVQSLLPDSGNILHLTKIPNKLFHHFGNEVNPFDWHLGDETSFYSFCINKWPNVEPIFLENDIADPCQKVLVQPNSKYPKSLKYIKLCDSRYEEMEDKDPLKIWREANTLYREELLWKGYARLGDVLPYMAEALQERCHYKCLAGAIYSPGHFYVNMLSSWNDLEHMMEDLQKAYEGGQSGEVHAIPNPDTIKVGLYVAVKRKLDGFWHRSLIKGQIGRGQYQVFNIDYGDLETVSIDSIRYLKIEFLNRMCAQAVECVAKLGGYYNSDASKEDVGLDLGRDHVWTEDDGKMFRRRINDRNLAIKFMEKVPVKDVPVWHVFIHVLNNGMRDFIGIQGLHIERQIMQMSKGLYISKLGDDNDQCGEVEFVNHSLFL